MRFRCNTHEIEVIITDTEREYVTPKGSWCRMYQCWLLTEKSPSEGKYRECEVVEVK